MRVCVCVWGGGGGGGGGRGGGGFSEERSLQFWPMIGETTVCVCATSCGSDIVL